MFQWVTLAGPKSVMGKDLAGQGLKLNHTLILDWLKLTFPSQIIFKSSASESTIHVRGQCVVFQSLSGEKPSASKPVATNIYLISHRTVW